MKLPSICFQTAASLSSALRARQIGVGELLEEFLARIDAHNTSAKAFITVTGEAARRRAADFDQRLARDTNLPPLFGIPFGTKDLIDIEGVPTTGGSAALRDNVAKANAEVIESVLEGGAISLGKTNLHEFAYGITGENRVFGTAVNAYDRTRLACGSSSGSAAAVAHGLAAFALGTDTGGSVRVPAVMNGLVGLKATIGRISTQGVMPFCWSLDHVGLITRSISDCALLFGLCADGAGGSQAARIVERPEKSDLSVAGLRIGVPESFYFERADPEILLAAERAISYLARAGAVVTKVSMPDASHARTVSLTIQMPEALSFHSRYLDERGHLYSADFRAGLALGQYILAEHYVRAKRLVSTYRAGMKELYDTVDVILTPAAPIVAPMIGAVSVTLDGVEEAIGDALTRFTAFFNMTGHPAVTLPITMHSLGLPIGIQLVGRYREEPLILKVAKVLEDHFGPAPQPYDDS